MKNRIILLMLLSIITAFSYQESYEVLAHFEEIDVTFDECIPVDYNEGNDGINEKWFEYYPLSGTHPTYHFYATSTFSTQTIKYYFNETEQINNNNSNLSYDELYKWDTDITTSEAIDLKNKYSDSMERWNNIYIYSIDNNNYAIKRKLVNIIEGTANDNNIIIYPTNSTYSVADTIYFDDDEDDTIIFTHNNHEHYHYEHYNMRVNIKEYKKAINKWGTVYHNRVGAHEMGHVMGLDDLDKDDHSKIQHHEEALMGYGDPRQTNITYKDIAGVMITMGFHTANDHKWMYTEDSNIVDPETGNIIINDGYKLICSICNGVKYTTSIPEGSVEYLSCGGNHSLTSNHMMAVASYGTKDYYKCKYCRYVAPFELNVEQSYGVREYISGNTLQHYAHSNNGLTYKILENHYSDYESNIYQQYSINDIRYSTKHIVRCGCSGVQMTKMHVFTSEDVNDGNTSTTCIDCNAVITNNGPGIVGPLNKNIWQVTDNGSYKLTNGIIILVEEDVDSYKEGTLVFKDANSEIM